MGTAEVLLPQHALLHTADVGNGSPSIADRTFAGATDSQIRLRPDKGLNSLAWLLWHMARTEDVNVNLVVTNGRQVWDDAWARRLNVARTDIGTGMTEDEVEELSEALDLSAARAYRSAVGRRTREVVASLDDRVFEEIVSAADVARASAAGAIGSRAEWLVPFWQNHSRATRLLTVCVTHNAIHLGEAQTLRSVAGFGLTGR
jgi:DinB superfamily